jgi:hypothetical protein
MPKPLREQATLVESVDKKTGKILVDIITPGDGTSGYYSPEVCEAAAGLVTAGTKMFLDHPTEAEEYERPVRSVKDIAAVFTESARWDPNRGPAGSLVAEARVVPAWIDTMDVIQGAIGVSIYGSATDIVEGEIDGRRTKIVEGLHAIDSVDFVTRPGRGGAFALMESANPVRVRERALRRGVAEATVNDTREALQTVLRDAYGGDKVYVWVRDFDETTVWFEIEDGEDSGVFGQPYTSSDGAVALSGDRTEVRVSTTYVPVNTRPDDPATKESEEDTMPKIQIEESEHTRLTETAGRVPTLESERDTAVAERDTARRDLAVERATGRARALIGESEHVFSELEADALVADLPLVEAEDAQVLDETAFGERITEAAKKSAAAASAQGGGIQGFGASADTDTQVTESGRPTTSPWGRPLEQKGA